MTINVNDFISTPYFGIALSIFTYEIGKFIQKKSRLTLLNPLLLAIIMCLGVLLGCKIPTENYFQGADMISVFLSPATTALAVTVYSQLDVFRKYWLPVLIGCLVGAVTSLVSVTVLCRYFDLSARLKMTLLPKSVTTPFAMTLSENLGGIPSVTVAVVVLTGILGAIIGPVLLRVFRIQDPVASGVAMGVSAHVAGTSRAIELGQTQGAMSSISLCMTGFITVFISIFI